MRKWARVKSLPFFIWHGRHELYHVFIGLIWAWVLRELWHEFNPKWITLSVAASLVPDLDHVLYFVGYGRSEKYAQAIRTHFMRGEWRLLWMTIENGHKFNTNLRYHNFYTMFILFAVTAAALFFDWNTAVVLFGAMFLHYLFDVTDDIVTLGYVNSNWKKWRRSKLASSQD